MSVADNTKHFQKGDIIFETNAPATHIYVLEKGELGVKYGDNPLVEVGSIVEGESFGESALLIGGNGRRPSAVSLMSLSNLSMPTRSKVCSKSGSMENSCASVFSLK